MWLVLTLVSMFAWGCADLFYKVGMSDNDPDNWLKIAVVLGLMSGLLMPLLKPFSESGSSLPELMRNNMLFMIVPVAYAASMTFSNIGLKYLELSIFSPVMHSSGALPVVFLILYYVATGRASSLQEEVSLIDVTASVLIIGGVIILAVIEQKLSGQTLHKGAKYLLYPLMFCVVDTIETVVCAIILEDGGVGEIDLAILYGAVFLAAGSICWGYIFMKTGKIYNPFTRHEIPKWLAAVCEDIAYVAYVFAIARKPLFVAPIIASFCIVSVILSRIFLHERIGTARGRCVLAVIIGIVMIGISEGLSYV